MKKYNPEVLAARLDAVMRDDLENCRIGGASVAVYQEGMPLFARCYGKKNTQTGEDMKPGTIFRLASMTKPLTAVALLMQVQAERIQLDDPVSKYISSYENMTVGKVESGRVVPSHPATEPIRVFHLLTHTSGLLPGDPVGVPQSQLPAEAMTSLKSVVEYYGEHVLLSNDPMAQSMYSGCAAFDVAARLVEICSGQPFGEFLKEHIFDPLGMTDATMCPDESQWARMTEMHNLVDGKNAAVDMGRHVFGQFPLTYPCGGAGACATVEDYCHFAEMLLNEGRYEGGEILSPEMIALMRKPWIPEDVPGIGAGETWGLGVRVIKDDPALPEGAFGWSGAYGTHFWVDPTNRLYAIYAKNSAYDGGSGALTARAFERCVMDAVNA